MILPGDCRETLRDLRKNSIGALVTDAPYGLSKQPDMVEVLQHWLAGDDYQSNGGGFMGKSWDSFVPGPATWREVYRVLKPGAHGLVFAGSRTQDLMAMALRLAGFEIRDTLFWLYGSGFPKSLDLGDGLGTALKPAYEPIILIRKPTDGTIKNNLDTWGTGGINIDGCRVGDELLSPATRGVSKIGTFENADGNITPARVGRWPANIMHDGCLEDETWSRYFYCPKTSKADRNEGCEHLEYMAGGDMTGGRAEDSAGLISPRAGAGRTAGAINHHPTVKPTALMQYLCRLVTPAGGTILDPFLGSGSTGKAAVLEGFDFIGCEKTLEYIPIAQARIDHGLVQYYCGGG